MEEPQKPSEILGVRGRMTQSLGCSADKVTTTPMFRDGKSHLSQKYISLSKIYMILLLFHFIPLFESPEMDFLVKRYAEFKKRTFENPKLETILLSDLPPDLTLKFRPLLV